MFTVFPRFSINFSVRKMILQSENAIHGKKTYKQFKGDHRDWAISQKHKRVKIEKQHLWLEMTFIILFFLKWSFQISGAPVNYMNFWHLLTFEYKTQPITCCLFSTFHLNTAPKTQKYDKLEERSKHDFPLGLCITFSKLWTFFPKMWRWNLRVPPS